MFFLIALICYITVTLACNSIVTQPKDFPQREKKILTIELKPVTIIKFIVYGGFIMLKALDVINYVSICFTIFGLSIFQLFEWIMNNGVTCSVNFRNKIFHYKLCNFSYRENWDRSAIAINAFLASLPYTLFIIIIPVCANFIELDKLAIALIYGLYIICASKSIFYLRKSYNKIPLLAFFILQIVAVVLCSILTLSATRLQDGSIIDFNLYCYRYFAVILLLFMSYVGLFINTQCLTDDSIVNVVYPATFNEDDNRFEISLKDGRILSSLDNFFYPVSHKDGVQLLYLDGTSTIVKRSNIDSFIIYGYRKGSSAFESISL